MKNNTEQKEGIYFNMPFTDYLAIPYFSRSAAQAVRFSGKQFQYSLKDPVQETPAMKLGTAIHSLFLEPKIFAETYVKEPAITDFPNQKVIQTVKDLEPYLKIFGLKKTGKKEELIDSLRSYLNPKEVIIWDDIERNFKEAITELGHKLIALSDEDYTTITKMRDTLSEYQELPKAIQNGRAEVVVIWKDKETGVMCKCRLDYVQPLAVTDVKSYSIKDFNTPLLDQLRKKTIHNFYNFQYAIYAEALETAIKAVNEGRGQVYGEDNKEWLKEFLENPKKQFFILYARTQAPYQMQVLELTGAEISGGGENAYFSVAQNIWRSAIKKYAHWLKTGGLEGGEWLGESEIEVLRDEHVPNVMWQQSMGD